MSLEATMCASSAEPGRPRSIGRLGAAAWKMLVQYMQGRIEARTRSSFIPTIPSNFLYSNDQFGGIPPASEIYRLSMLVPLQTTITRAPVEYAVSATERIAFP